MGDRDLGEVRYRAFLSYSHKDAAAAGRLHRRLEAWRVPRRLVGRETAAGAVPGRLWPIFRDREELPAATDLSETVRAALAQSGALIVLCSPHAATSLWVAEEIRVFRELHPDRPILAAILDGDPPDCFPSLLRAFGEGHEPLATDLRRHRDGERLGLLKLVAGITGLGLDDLVQRDATRRVRRVMAVLAGVVLVMMITATLAVIAITARYEAESQRAEAESLAEFMLTDLRDRLREVGRLDIMRGVNERALAYHDRQLQLHDNPGDRIMRARILHVIGEDGISLGDLRAAETALREAHRITAHELALAPQDPARLLDHAKSEYWLGRVPELRRDWSAAQRQYALFAAAAQRLIAVDPRNPEYMTEMGWSAFNLGNVELNGLGNAAAAQRSFERAVLWFERVVRAQPQRMDAQRTLANAYAGLADSFFVQQAWSQSLTARQQQYRITERLYRADPANLMNGYRFALAQRGIAVSLLKTGNPVAARREIFSAYDWSLRLVRRDSGNAEWQLFRIQVGCELYYRDFGMPHALTRSALAGTMRDTWQDLMRQNDPRARDVARCVESLA